MRSLFVASSLFFAFAAVFFHPAHASFLCSRCRHRAQPYSSPGAATPTVAPPRPPPRHPHPIQGWVNFTAAQSPEIDWNSGADPAVPDWVHQVDPCVNWMKATKGRMDIAEDMSAEGYPGYAQDKGKIWPEPAVTLYRGTTVSGFRALQSALQAGDTVIRAGRWGWGLYFTIDPAVAWAFARPRRVSANKTSSGLDDEDPVVLKITVRPSQLTCWAPHLAVLEDNEKVGTSTSQRERHFLEFVLREEEQKNMDIELLQAA